MSAKIISLQDVKREHNEKRLPENQDFHTLFARAHELRSKDFDDVSDKNEIAQQKNLKDWFQRELADEVFHQKLFSTNVLVSIWFVSDLLASFAHNEIHEIGIVEHIAEYASNGKPECILKAANSAFLLFVFWPETRANRSVRYRKLARAHGPALYAQYASAMHKDFGYYMAEAFVPLGDIARQRFSS